jgi:hypothetical protein
MVKVPELNFDTHEDVYWVSWLLSMSSTTMTLSPGVVARAIVAAKKAKQTSQSTAAEHIVADSTTENMEDNETLSQTAPAATRTASENAKGKTISESGTNKTRDNGREKVELLRPLSPQTNVPVRTKNPKVMRRVQRGQGEICL